MHKSLAVYRPKSKSGHWHNVLSSKYYCIWVGYAKENGNSASKKKLRALSIEAFYFTDAFLLSTKLNKFFNFYTASFTKPHTSRAYLKGGEGSIVPCPPVMTRLLVKNVAT